MPNEMIEKVARAMADYACINYQHNKAIYDAYAKAAIEAMRKPTEEILDSILPHYHFNPEKIWNDIINEALKDG